MWPGPGGGPGRWLGSGRRRESEILGNALPGLSQWLRDRYRGHGEGPGDIGSHLAQFGRQPDRAGPQLVGFPLGGFAHRLGLASRLPPDLPGLPLGLQPPLGLVSRLPPYLGGLPLGVLAYRGGLVPRLPHHLSSLFVGLAENPLRQPDGVRVAQSPGVPPHRVEHLRRALRSELAHLPDTGNRGCSPLLADGGGFAGNHLGQATAEGDLVIPPRSRARCWGPVP